MAKKKQPKQKEKKFTLDLVREILGGLNTLWGKIGIISVLIVLGFKAGCFYQEIISNKNFDNLNKKYNDELLDIRIKYNEKIYELIEKYGNPEIKKDIIDLKYEKENG